MADSKPEVLWQPWQAFSELRPGTVKCDRTVHKPISSGAFAKVTDNVNKDEYYIVQYEGGSYVQYYSYCYVDYVRFVRLKLENVFAIPLELVHNDDDKCDQRSSTGNMSN